MMTEINASGASSEGGSTPSEGDNSPLSPFRKLSEMWHPHVYGHPPKCPTPFSIEDILSRHSQNVSASGGVRRSFGGGSLGGDSPRGQSPGLEEDDRSGSSTNVLDQPLNLTTKKVVGLEDRNRARGKLNLLFLW